MGQHLWEGEEEGEVEVDQEVDQEVEEEVVHQVGVVTDQDHPHQV